MSFGAKPRRGCLLPLLKPGRLQNYRAVVCSEKPVTLSTHFLGRTLVCPGDPDCGLCDLGKPVTWHGYVAIERDRKVFLLRLTAPCVQGLAMGSLKPCRCVVLDRSSARRPLRISLGGESSIRRQVSYLELLHVVAKLHLLPAVRFDLSFQENEARLRRAAIANCRHLPGIVVNGSVSA